MPTAAPTDHPSRLSDLTQAEHLLVWSLRAMAVGHGDCPTLGRTFDRLCAPAGPAALQAYSVLVQLIGLSSRRRLKVHVPGCICLGHDETAVVGVVAAARQALDDGDDNLLRLRLGFLAQSGSVSTLCTAALAVAEALRQGRLDLPVRLDDQPLPRAPVLGGLHAVH